MSRRSFTSIFILMVLAVFSTAVLWPGQGALADQSAKVSKPAPGNAVSPGRGKKARKTARKGPIVITSDTLSADQSAHTAVFEGRVAAKNDGMELFADKMVVHYDENGGVSTIDATGSVKLIKEERVVTAGKAHYDKADDSVLFSENPKIVQAGTVVTGTAITYYVSTDKMDVKNSKVFIEGR